MVRLGCLSPCQGRCSSLADSCHHLPGYRVLCVAVPGHPLLCPQAEAQGPGDQG